MPLRPLRAGVGSLALAALALAHPGPTANDVETIEDAWGGAPETGLHRLLRDLVREAPERPPGAQSTDGASHERPGTPR